MLRVVFPFLRRWEGRRSGNDDQLVIKVVLVFGSRGRGVTHVFMLLNCFFYSMGRPGWRSGGLFCRQWLMSVAHCFPSWKQQNNVWPIFVWKFSKQGMSSAISLYFSFHLCSFPLQEWLLSNMFGGDASNIIYVHFTNFKIKEMLIYPRH